MAITKKALAIWNDSMTNLVSGLGVLGVDKSVHTAYGFAVITDDQLMKAYRGDWIARKIIDIPAHDATREWRLWEAEDDQITELEEAERELSVKMKVRDALIKARLFGGSVIIMGVRNDDPKKELKPESVKQGDLKFLHVAARNEVTAGPLIQDPMSEFFGTPEYYTFSAGSVGKGGSMTIHPSRVVRFIGNPIPQIFQGNGWGDSVLQANDDAIKQAGTVSAALSVMINECKTDVLHIPDLMQNLSTQEYEQQLMARLQLASTAKSIVNTLILDKEEEWQRIQTNFSGLDVLLSTFLTIASGAADIPATRMLGQSAKGLNATGESDMRNYYDMVAAQQENVMRPAMKIMDEVLIRHSLGDRPEEVSYEWAPLWQLDDETKAKIAFNKAQALAIHHDSGLIDPTALSDALINQLVEDNIYPGLQQALLDSAKTTPGFDPAMASPNPSIEKPLTPQEEAANEIAKTKAEAGPAIGGPAGNASPKGRDVPKQKGAKNAKSQGQRTAANTDAVWNDHLRRLKFTWGDFNPNHEPAGTPEGGQFARGQAEAAQNPEQDPFLQTLTQDERDALRKFTSDGYWDVNGILRGTQRPDALISFGTKVPQLPYHKGGRDVQATLDAIDAAMDKASWPEDSYVYRMYGQKGTSGIGEPTPGQQFIDKGFVSTSKIPDGFAHQVSNARLARIRIPAGTKAIDVHHVSAHPSEHEVLLDHGLTFTVTNVGSTKVGAFEIPTIEMEVSK